MPKKEKVNPIADAIDDEATLGKKDLQRIAPKEGMICLVLENGGLRYMKPDEFRGKDAQFVYFEDTSDDKFRVYDLDKGSVKPVVKSILNQIGLFPELTWLKMNFIVAIIVALIATIGLLSSFTKASNSNMDSGFKKATEDIKKYCKPSELLKVPTEEKKSNFIEQIGSDSKKNDITPTTGPKKGTEADF